MLRVYRGNDERIDIANDEKNLLEFVAGIEKGVQNTPALLVDGEEKVHIFKKDILALCAAAGVAYESQNWYERETGILERICQKCDIEQFPPEVQQELSDWWKEHQDDVMLADVIQKRLAKWKCFHKENE